MRFQRRRHSHLRLMNMTPMIDVVFLLLIFFMTVSEISRLEGQQIQLPELAGSDNQPLVQHTIHVDAQGHWHMLGAPREPSWTRDYLLREIRRAHGDTDRLTVVIRADRRCDSASVNQIVHVLRELSVHRVRFAVFAP